MQRFERLTIGASILVITVTVVGAGMAMLAGLLFFRFEALSQDALVARGRVIAEGTARNLTGSLVFDDPRGATELLATLENLGDARRAILFDAAGESFASFEGEGPGEVLPAGSSEAVELRPGAALVRAPIVRDGEFLGSLSIHFSTAALTEQRRSAQQATVLLTLAMILACAFLTWRLRNLVIGPIQKLAGTMRGIAAGGLLDTRVEHARSDVLGQLYDVFNQMLAELDERQRELRTNEARMRALLEAAPDMVMVLDEHARVVELPSTGMSKPRALVGRLLGKRLDELLEEGSTAAIRDAMARTLESSSHPPLSFTLEIDGRPVEFDATISPMGVAPGLECPGKLFVMLCRDMTERRELQNQLQQAQKMESIGQLAGGIAHDFNNLLAGIVGYAELMKVARNDDAKRAHADEILSIAERAGDLVDNLLAFSRRAERKIVPTDLNRVIKRVGGIARRTFDPRIRVTFLPTDEPAIVVGDPAQLESALLNLAVNARDAMPEGGELELSVELTPGASGREARRCVLRVRDTGTGIPAEILSRNYEPFFTTKEVGKGSGLGLAAVYGTVQSTGGTLEVESEEGQGTCFTLSFPLSEEREARVTEPETEAAPRSGGHVLVVDDEPIICNLSRELLEHLGYRVSVADGGPAAIELVNRMGSELDAVVMDMAMPQMSGAEAARKITEVEPDLPIIIASGFDLHGEGKDELGRAAAILNKPFGINELDRTLREVLG
ncbi:MAG: ATP-binding protein [Deltaproteobacteria bacterium]|nr:ATP-binding protein [Deltaproteobacteria bacterium]